MKKLATLILIAVLTGCAASSSPVKIKWPKAPEELMTPTADLTPLPTDKNTFADLLENANDNFAQYYILKSKIETWQQWYNTQKKIYEDAE